MDILQFIKQNYDKFTESEKLIADYLTSLKESIVHLSAKEIGEATGTSAPTVIRFVQKIGFNSLNEMKIKLEIALENVNGRGSEFNYLDKDLSTQSIIEGVRRTSCSIIDETVYLINQEQLDNAINTLIKAKNIYIFGVGVSGLVGTDFYYKLSRINKKCTIFMDTHLQVTSSVLMEEGDVALAISYSGETREVLLCVENAKKNNIPVISITKASIGNSLESISDIVLYVPGVEKTLREGAMSSRLSQLLIIDMLFLGIARSDLEHIENMLKVTRKAVENLYSLK